MKQLRLQLSVLTLGVATMACSSTPAAPTTSEELLLEPHSATLVGVGDSAIFRLRKSGIRGNDFDCPGVRWKSTDEGVVRVNGSGMVKAKAAGFALVYALCGTMEASASVQVLDAPEKQVLKAFPEAEGWGAGALGSCRSGGTEVLAVTNLEDAGPGSLREAVEVSQDDRLSIIVFRVGGYLDLKSDIKLLDRACIYFAGQTAPGDGITIRRSPGRSFYIKGTSHDIVFRHLRFRGRYTGPDGSHIGIQIGSGENYVLDHLSFSWMTGKFIVIKKSAVAWSHPVSRVTVQRSVLAEILSETPTAMQISGEDNDGATDWKLIQDISVHHNLFAHNGHRNPNVTTVGTEVINNVIYNWRQGAVQSTRGSRLDVISNVFMPGPMTHRSYLHEVTWDCETHEGFEPSLYVAGNVGPHNADLSADNSTGASRMTACYYNTGGDAGAELPSRFHRDAPLTQPDWPVTVQSASAVRADVLGSVGASARLACEGGWFRRSDAADQRIFSDVRNGTGPTIWPKTEVDAGGFPTLDSGQACRDQDEDGMPDDFEERVGFNPRDPKDAAQDSDGDGYSNIEEYVNSSI